MRRLSALGNLRRLSSGRVLIPVALVLALVVGVAAYGYFVSHGTGSGSALAGNFSNPATHLVVSAPGSATAGNPFSVTVTAKDQYGNTVTNYAGTIQFTTTDGGSSSVVPADYTFVAGDSGTHTFTRGVTLVTAGIQTVTATDTVNPSITGTSGNITVTAAGATHFLVAAPGSVTAGNPFSVTVTAKDQFGNVATGYTGTIHFTKSDGGAGSSVPANYTFVAGDSGTHTFSSGVTLVTAGIQTVTATDTVTSSITGTSGNITVTAAGATHFLVAAPGSVTAGNPFSVTVTALDPYGNVATGYTGTIHFTKADSGAGSSVPANYTFVAGDNGTHTFSSGVTLVTAGIQTVTATDTVNSPITGTSGNITVTAAGATHFLVAAPGSATAGNPFSVTVTAEDQFGNVATGYTGTIRFTKADSGAGSSVPGNYTFVAGDNGVHTFTNGVTLVTAGNQTVTATDTAQPSITGTSGNITVTAAGATHLTVTAPGSATAGSPFSVSVTAKDQFGNVATGYTGTIHFTTTDSGASSSVPANYTFVAGDSGTHTFTSGVTLVTAGSQTVTATDTVTPSITGTSGNITVTAAGATHLTVTAPGSVTAGSPFSVTVTAKDQFGNLATGYTGTIHFTKSDGGAGSSVPANYTFVAGDSGAHTFTNGAMLVTAGIQTITATDTAQPAITGTSGNITVTAAGATHFSVTAPGSVTAGNPFSVTVTAEDQFGNVATGYTGTIHFTKTDAGAGSSVPANYTFVAGDNGTHTFTSGVTLVTAGTQTVTATDTVNPSITGTSGNITVTAAGATHLTVPAPSSATAGSPFSVTVTAEDQFGNIATGYTGTIHFTTTDAGAGTALPSNYTFVAGDRGTHTFTSGVTLVTAGTQTVTATDTVTSAITGTSGNISVAPGAASAIVLSGGSSLQVGTGETLTARIEDAHGNTIATGADSSRSVTFSQTSGTGSLSGLTSAGAIGGVATDPSPGTRRAA